MRFRQTEWLFNLYQKFYEEPQYKRIRYILDFKPKEEFSKLQSAVEEDKEDSIVDDSTDYLNFFEFVCSLWRMNQVTSGEILFLFQYYIENLSSIEFVKSIIEKEGFESLSLFIKRQHYSN